VTPPLAAVLGLERHELVAFVGGGGKSTLTLRLGRELADAQRAVALTTTTKMGADQIPNWAVVCHSAAEAAVAIEGGRPAFLLGVVDGPKAIGVEPALVDELYATGGVTIVAEADGARRRPFKAPGKNEPVIPSLATLVVVVAGIDALGGRIADVCHRPERVAVLTGRSVDDALRPADMATVLTHPDGGRKHVPANARLVVALTKVTRRHDSVVAVLREACRGRIDVVAIPASG